MGWISGCSEVKSTHYQIISLAQKDEDIKSDTKWKFLAKFTTIILSETKCKVLGKFSTICHTTQPVKALFKRTT